MTVTHATQCEPCLAGWYCVSGSLYLCPAGLWFVILDVLKIQHLLDYFKQFLFKTKYKKIFFHPTQRIFKFPFFCIRLLLPWRNWIWLEKLSRGNVWSRARLCNHLAVQAVWRWPLLLFQKWHRCEWAVSERILLFIRKHLSTAFPTGSRYTRVFRTAIKQMTFWCCFTHMWRNILILCLSSGEGGPCPTGHYCPQATADPLPCPQGTFSNLTKLVSKVALTQLS